MKTEYKDGYRNWWSVEIGEGENPPFICDFNGERTEYRAWGYSIIREGVEVHHGTVEIEKDRGKPSAAECLSDFMGHIGRVCMGLTVAAESGKTFTGGG